MKRPFFLLFCAIAAAVLFGGTGCEQHPLEQTKARQAENAEDAKSSGH